MQIFREQPRRQALLLSNTGKKAEKPCKKVATTLPLQWSHDDEYTQSRLWVLSMWREPDEDPRIFTETPRDYTLGGGTKVAKK